MGQNLLGNFFGLRDDEDERASLSFLVILLLDEHQGGTNVLESDNNMKAIKNWANRFRNTQMASQWPINYAEDSRVAWQTDAHDVTAAVEGRPDHGLDGGGPRDALHLELVGDIRGKVDLVQHEYGLGQIEAGELDLMQVEKLVNLFPAPLLDPHMLLVEVALDDDGDGS